MRGLLFYPVKSAHSLAVRTCNDEVTIREQVREIWYRWLLHLVHDLLALALMAGAFSYVNALGMILGQVT
jgi:hypothetical protein